MYCGGDCTPYRRVVVVAPAPVMVDVTRHMWYSVQCTYNLQVIVTIYIRLVLVQFTSYCHNLHKVESMYRVPYVVLRTVTYAFLHTAIIQTKCRQDRLHMNYQNLLLFTFGHSRIFFCLLLNTSEYFSIYFWTHQNKEAIICNLIFLIASVKQGFLEFR